MEGIVRRAIVLLTLMMAGSASASEQDARLSRLAWSAFECHELARISGDDGEKDRLFKVGLDASMTFVEKFRAGEISEDDRFMHVPGGISRAMEGPSVEFVVGRIYQVVAGNTYEDVTQRDSGGKRLPPEKYVVDPVEVTGIARTKYREANCELIK
ncbi:hypothetical protein [Sinorhizobium meliloti]|uniref:hypothetical protein n=1 Tax=Rhizobium meliloti TaxID=382 RepID=UPI00398CEE15